MDCLPCPYRPHPPRDATGTSTPPDGCRPAVLRDSRKLTRVQNPVKRATDCAIPYEILDILPLSGSDPTAHESHKIVGVGQELLEAKENGEEYRVELPAFQRTRSGEP